MSTVFTVTCSNWKGSGQLQYEFSTLSGAAAPASITTLQPSAYITTMLPPASAISIRISDVNDIVTTTTVPVSVTAPSGTTTSIVKSGLDTLQLQVLSGNVDSAAVGIAGYAQLLNNDSSDGTWCYEYHSTMH